MTVESVVLMLEHWDYQVWDTEVKTLQLPNLVMRALEHWSYQIGDGNYQT